MGGTNIGGKFTTYRRLVTPIVDFLTLLFRQVGVATQSMNQLQHPGPRLEEDTRHLFLSPNASHPLRSIDTRRFSNIAAKRDEGAGVQLEGPPGLRQDLEIKPNGPDVGPCNLGKTAKLGKRCLRGNGALLPSR